jgi:hypothetical protein
MYSRLTPDPLIISWRGRQLRVRHDDPRIGPMRQVRLTHRDLDSWVDVRRGEWDGRWLAVADLAGEPDIGTGLGPREAAKAAPASLGEPHATEIAESGLDSS